MDMNIILNKAIEVCKLWIDDIRRNRADFLGADIFNIDQLIAFEVASKLNMSDMDYERYIAVNPLYDETIKSYLLSIEELI